MLTDAAPVVAGMESPTRVFGTSYFAVFRYNVYAIEKNLSRYVDEIDEINADFATGDIAKQKLLSEINNYKRESRYHPRTANRIYSLTRKNYEDPRSTSEDKWLIAMTYWQICKLQKVPSVLKFLLKGMKGGRNTDYQFVENGGRYTCVDTSAITAALCKKAGIEGSIKNDGIGSVMGFHHFFETKSGRIIDVPFGLLESGFFFDAKNHPKTSKIVFAFLKSIIRKIVRKIGIRS